MTAPNAIDTAQHALDVALRHVADKPDVVRQLSDARNALARLRDDATQSGLADRRLTALLEVTRAISTSLDLEEVLNLTMDSAIRLTGAERGFLMGVNANTGDLEVRVARNVQQESINANNVEMQISHSVMQHAASTGEPVLTTNAQEDPRFAQQVSVVSFALRSIMCAPLRIQGRVIGVVYVDNRVKSGIFQPADLDLLSAFASAAAVAIENARLYTLTDQALHQRIAELQTMQQIDRDLNTVHNFADVMALTLNWAIRGAQAETGWLAVVDRGVAALRVVAGDGRDELLSLNHPALHAETPVLVNTESDGPCLLAALRRDREVLGLLAVCQAEPFDERARAFLERYAEHAAIAVENAQLVEQLRATNDAKNRFISHISHELRLPMTSIQGYADLLKGGMFGPLNEQQLQFVEVIRNNVVRMKTLVSDLADISRIESGRLKIEPRAVPVSSAVNDALVNLRPMIEGRRQTLVVSLPDGLPTIWVDHTRLHQILTNLISNANKYTPDGGQIEVSARLENDRVAIAVTDTGIGIAPDDLAQLFTQFFRSEHQAVREQQGWGLGLHVARLLTQAMGGQIAVESTPGLGSTFTVWLPIQPVALPN